MTQRPSNDTTSLLWLVAIFVALGVVVTPILLWSVIRSSPLGPPRVISVPPPPIVAAPEVVEQAAVEITEPTPAVPDRVIPDPRWIWGPGESSADQELQFRRLITLPSSSRDVELRVSADNHAEIFINGESIGETHDWSRPDGFDLASYATDDGDVEIVIRAWNDGGPAGLLVSIDWHDEHGDSNRVVSDTSWEVGVAGVFDETTAREIGPLGIAPWGALAGFFPGDVERQIEVPDGFEVDLVYAVPGRSGSWVSLALDHRDRLIAGDQYGSLYRITMTGGDADVETLGVEVGMAQGLLCVGTDLYCMTSGGGPEGQGLYRVRDTDDDDQYDSVELLRAIPGRGGEHGPHGLALGPDGLLYATIGNHVPLTELDASVVPRHWGEDHLLPRLWDPRGHAVGKMAPGGWIARTDLDGRSWELIAIGFRNTYDIAFDPDGELFTYDADMEWDFGAPWYRPTRVNHVTSGSDSGWRSGSAKWPAWYPDGLPAAVDIGPGSPTGVLFGTGSRFPERYQRALYLLDWTYGTIHAVHLEPHGSSYRAVEREVFVAGRPLPVTDAVMHPDGAMYFAVGGRRLPSALFRVRATDPTDALDAAELATANTQRDRRRELESHHHAEADAAAIDDAWSDLGSDDPFLRHAARLVLEHQPVRSWWSLALREDRPEYAVTAMLAAARCGDGSGGPLVDHMLDVWPDDPELQRDWARVLELILIRQPDISGPRTARLRGFLEDLYPTGVGDVDQKLCELLVHLRSSVVVTRTIPLLEQAVEVENEWDPELIARSDSYGSVIQQMNANPPQSHQVQYAMTLRHAVVGWTLDLRERYFRWFASARRTSGGMSFTGFLDAMRREALEATPEVLREQLDRIGTENDPLWDDLGPVPSGPGRAWTVQGVLDEVSGRMNGRDYERGRRMYEAASCAQCHRFAGWGVGGGPDLTALATRFSIRDLAEALVEPSRVISDQYEMTEFTMRDGSVVVGRVVLRDDTSIRILPSLLAQDQTMDVAVSEIVDEAPSAVSAMMPRLLDRLNPTEVRDLFAYMLSEGDPRNSMFAQADGGGFEPMFDGTSLSGWTGDERFWSVRDGEIVGRSTAEQPVPKNTFLIWEGEPVGDFELHFEVKLAGDNNSGVQYRAERAEGFGMRGYQCDVHPAAAYTGMLYEEGGRGIMATVGRHVRIGEDGSTTDLEPAAEPVPRDVGVWNEFTIIARGHRVEHRMNGETVVVVEDDGGATRGLIGLQLHAGTPYEVRLRNLRIRRVEADQDDASR